jgi:O-antigen ligase
MTLGKLLNPRLRIILFLFVLAMMIVPIHQEFVFLGKIHIELVLMLVLVILNSLNILRDHFFNEKPISISYFEKPLLLLSWFIFLPLLSSFFNQDYLWIFEDGEFRSLVKIFIFLHIAVSLRDHRNFKKYFADSLIVFYFLLGVYFIYRFFWLNEIRDFDGRPSLKIRNGDPNFLCTFFSMIVPLAIYRALHFFNRRQIWASLLMTGISVVLVFCSLVTESRMGILALTIGLIGLIFLNKDIQHKMKWFFLLFVATSFGLIFSFGGIVQRFQQMNDRSNGDRLLTFQNGVQIFLESPILGVGMHKAKDFFFENTQYPAFQSESKRLQVHNTFLSLLAELGLIGLSIYMAILYWVYQRLLLLSRERRTYFMSSLVILLISSLSVGLAYKDLVFLHLFSLVLISMS